MQAPRTASGGRYQPLVTGPHRRLSDLGEGEAAATAPRSAVISPLTDVQVHGGETESAQKRSREARPLQSAAAR
jgi:hypothetical protein